MDGELGWTVLLRDGVPKDWARAARVVLDAMASPAITAGDVNRAVRMGRGFVDLPMTSATSERVAAALCAAGLEARGLRWAECEASEPPLRVKRLDFEGPEAAPGMPWARVQVLHTVVAAPAPFFLPPEVNPSTRTAGVVARGVSWGAVALGIPLLDEAASAVGKFTDSLGEPVAPGGGTPELVVELLGLWAPRVQLAVSEFQHEVVPGPPATGTRARLAKLLAAIVARAPKARLEGVTTQALRRELLEGQKPLPASDHKRQVSAWLTASRLWPPS
ncbi:MAG: hypothetical protein AB1938_12830 [Myxococcota bacterium]